MGNVCGKSPPRCIADEKQQPERTVPKVLTNVAIIKQDENYVLNVEARSPQASNKIDALTNAKFENKEPSNEFVHARLGSARRMPWLFSSARFLIIFSYVYN